MPFLDIQLYFSMNTDVIFSFLIKLYLDPSCTLYLAVVVNDSYKQLDASIQKGAFQSMPKKTELKSLCVPMKYSAKCYLFSNVHERD